MSQNNKPSLWQKIKQRLMRAKSLSGNNKDKIEDKSADDADNSARPMASTQASDVTDVHNDGAHNDAPDNNNPHIDTKTEANNNTDNKITNNKKAQNNATPAQNNATDTPANTAIVDYIKHYFDQRRWRYTHYRPKSGDPQRSHHLSLRVKNKQTSCGYLIRVQEGNRLLAVYGVLPFLIPESHQSAAMLLITQINYDMLIGNLEMDVNDGEIRFKHAVDVDVVGIDDAVIEHLLQSVIAMTTVAYEIFSDLLATANPSEDLPTLLLELRAQADARTFFLPTDFVQ